MKVRITFLFEYWEFFCKICEIFLKFQLATALSLADSLTITAIIITPCFGCKKPWIVFRKNKTGQLFLNQISSNIWHSLLICKVSIIYIMFKPEPKLRTLFKRILVGKYPTWTDLNLIYWGGLCAKKLRSSFNKFLEKDRKTNYFV